MGWFFVVGVFLAAQAPSVDEPATAPPAATDAPGTPEEADAPVAPEGGGGNGEHALAAPLEPKALGPGELPPVHLRYRIDVAFLPEARKLEGEARIEWTNPTGGPVESLPLHLYLNGFSHDSTTWAEGAGEIGRFEAGDLTDTWDDPWGYTDVVRVRQRTATGERDVELRYLRPDDPSPLDTSLAELRLAEPVGPGETVSLALSFVAKMPVPIARTGVVPGWIHAAQWFPKIGVWDPPGHRPGWTGGFAARQFHGPTEFYADFADFDVAIDLPAGWSVVATGKPAPLDRTARPGFTRYRFLQRAVHDFAWVASTHLAVSDHVIENPGGGPKITLSIVVPEGRESDVPRNLAAAKATFEVLARRVGPYPYDSMKVVLPPWKALETGGMEYPTLVTSAPADPLFDVGVLAGSRIPEAVTAHEVTHNYFYGIVANDEQREAFLDEGFTQFWEQMILEDMRLRHEEEHGPWGPPWEELFGLPATFFESSRRAVGRSTKLKEPPLLQPSYLFYPGSAGHQIYNRTALLFRTVDRRYGPAVVDEIFRSWFTARRFTHPTADAFLAHVDEHAPVEVAGLVREVYGAAAQPDYAVAEAEVGEWPGPTGWVLVGEERVHIEDPRNTDVAWPPSVGSSRVDLQACKLEYSIVSPK